MRELVIADRLIADDAPCYVVAEIGGNHGGSVETCLQMISEAACAGADAVKLQKRDNATLYAPALLQKPYDNEHSYGKTYREHRAALEFGLPEYRAATDHAVEVGIPLFATAFDERSADFLMRLDVPAFKIASGGLTDAPLLRHVAGLGKPVIMSTGGGTLKDIDRAVNLITAVNPQLAVLHCTAAYPAVPDEQNLKCIETLRHEYPELVIGFSSHLPGIALSLVAYAMGARIIEHHFTLNRAGKGTDHGFSLEPRGLQTLCDDLRKAHCAMGDGVKRWYQSEKAPVSKMRRVWTGAAWQIDGTLSTSSTLMAPSVSPTAWITGAPSPYQTGSPPSTSCTMKARPY